MLDDLDQTIEELLRRQLPPDLLKQVDISFAAPDKQFADAVHRPAINFFLYDIRENRELRSNEPIVEPQPDGSVRRRAAPARVECSYLVTAWPGPGAPQQEHLLLSEVVRAVLRTPVIPADLLKGSLAGQVPALPTTSLEPKHLQNSGEIWQALGRPKSVLHFAVTMAVDAHAPQSVRRVEQKRLQFEALAAAVPADPTPDAVKEEQAERRRRSVVEERTRNQ